MLHSLGTLLTLGFGDATATVNCQQGDLSCNTGLPDVTTTNGEIQTILQIVFGIIGGIAVIIIMIAGLRFITAQGNPQEVSKARMTILYAIIGLIVMIGAEAIVSFVLFRV